MPGEALEKLSDRVRGRKLIEYVLAGEKPPCVPIYGVITHDELIEHYTGEKLTRENAERLATTAYKKTVDLTRLFFDTLGPCWDFDSRPDSFGYLWRHERWTKWLEKRPYSTVEGMCEALKKQIESFRAWKPESTAKDDILALSASGSVPQIQAELGDDVLLVGRVALGTAPGPYFRDGFEIFTSLLVDYPELLDEWVVARHQMNLRKIAALANAAACPVEFLDADLAYKGGLFVSPQFLRESGWFRRVAELVDCYHAQGLKVIFHSDGDLRRILPELFATGIDGLNPIETAAGMSVGELHRQFPDKILVGGLDNHTLIHGSASEVREATWRCLKEGGPRLILGTSTEEFDASMPVANLAVALETVWQYRP